MTYHRLLPFLLSMVVMSCANSWHIVLHQKYSDLNSHISDFGKLIDPFTFIRHTRTIQSNFSHSTSNYDVPLIECPPGLDGIERLPCPTPNAAGRYRCVDDQVLCDGFIDCPNAEDEERTSCMFYRTIKLHLDVLANAMLRWAREKH